MVNTVVYCRTNRSLPDDICGFCREDLRGQSAVVAHKDIGRNRLVHHIHLDCIRQWVTTQPICPQCKRPVDLDSLASITEKITKIAINGISNLSKEMLAACCAMVYARYTQQSPVVAWLQIQTGAILFREMIPQMSYVTLFSMILPTLIALLKDPEIRTVFIAFGIGAFFSNEYKKTYFPIALLISAMLPIWLYTSSYFPRAQH